MQGLTAWSPASLPQLEKLDWSRKPKSFAHAVGEVFFGFLFLVWLALIPEYPFLLLGPGLELVRRLPFAVAPVVMVFYYWVLALNVLQVGWHAAALPAGRWQERRTLQDLVFKAIVVIPLVVLLRAPGHALVLLKTPAVNAAHYGATVAALNAGVHKALLVVLVIVAAQFVWDLGKWLLGLRGRDALVV
jgi:hypothetical protein